MNANDLTTTSNAPISGCSAGGIGLLQFRP